MLGSMNLSEYVTEDKHFDYETFDNDIQIAVRCLNDVLDEGLSLHPLKEQRESVGQWRQIGLGIMGLADMLIKLEIPYDSDRALRLCNNIANTMINSAIWASANIASNKGVFDNYNEQMLLTQFASSNLNYETYQYVKEHGLRNSQLLTIAPTGTLSSMLGISGGLEPIFANSYTRKTESLHGKDVYYKVYTPIVDQYMKQNNIENEEDLPEWFVTAETIDPFKRIEMQAVWQKHIDASISSTVNLPNSATVEEVEQLYMYAWKQGLKGLTIFRNGCKRMGVLTTDTPKQEPNTSQENTTTLQRGDIIACTDDLIGKKRKIMTGCVDAETEFFNGKEWKKISEYEKGDLVLQYNSDGTASLVEPLKYIKRESKGMYHIKNKYGLDMMLSPDHRNVTFWNKNSKPVINTTEDLTTYHNRSKYGFPRKFKKSFIYDGPGINLTDDEIRLSVAIFADGCFYSPSSKKCDISVLKERKKDRIVQILESSGRDYTIRKANNGYYHIKFYPPIDGRQKTFPCEWYNCSQYQLQVIFEEVFYWDGYEKEHNQYTSIFKENADFIQFVCSAVGKSSSIYKDERTREKNCHICYRVDWSDRILRSIVDKNKKDIPFIQPEDGYEYCFSVPSTMLVLRRNDKIFITGNCGPTHILAYFDPDTADLMEVYLNKGSEGGCALYMTGLSRMISLACRAGVDIMTIKDQLDSTGACPSYAVRSATKHDTSKGSCCPMAIGNALVDMWEEMQQDLNADESNITFDKPIDKSLQNDIMEAEQEKHDVCPECGEPLQHSGGCDFCVSCGFSHCG